MASDHDIAVPAGFEPGSVIAEKFRIERVLGAGTMGIVVQAYHLQLEDWVALKVMLPAVLDNAEAVVRFLREARAAVKIKSEHIARVSDIGTLESGAPYMVMEYLQGQDLAALLAENGPLPVEQATDYILQACEALAEAHSLGIVHRDLKPENLFCAQRPDGTEIIKVLDFGIAKAAPGTADSDFAMTKTAVVMGSPLYMSPEQLECARNVDARSDIWSLGAVLYELLCGQTPFLAQSLVGLMLQISQEPATPPRSLRADLPAPLAQVLMCCLEKDRARRYPNVAELARALSPFAPRQAQGAVERAAHLLGASWQTKPARTKRASDPGANATDARRGRQTQASFGHTKRTSEAQRKAYWASAAVVVGLLGVLSSWFLRTSRSIDGQPAAAAPLAVSAQTKPRVNAALSEPGVEARAPHPSASAALRAPARLVSPSSTPGSKAPPIAKPQLRSAAPAKHGSLKASSGGASSAKATLSSLIEDRK